MKKYVCILPKYFGKRLRKDNELGAHNNLVTRGFDKCTCQAVMRFVLRFTEQRLFMLTAKF